MSFFGGGSTAVDGENKNPAPQSEEFKKAYNEAAEVLKGKSISNEEQTRLYGLATVGKDEKKFNPEVKLGYLDLKGKYKREGWKKALDEGFTPAEAQAEYVKFVEELKAK